jgi:hypothetical protein
MAAIVAVMTENKGRCLRHRLRTGPHFWCSQSIETAVHFEALRNSRFLRGERR